MGLSAGITAPQIPSGGVLAQDDFDIANKKHKQTHEARIELYLVGSTTAAGFYGGGQLRLVSSFRLFESRIGSSIDDPPFHSAE